MTRTPLSDDTLLGYALFVVMATVAVFAVLGLGAFAYNEAHQRGGTGVERTISLPLLDEKPAPALTEVLLFPDGALALGKQSVRPEKVVALLEEIRRTAPSVLIRCKPNVPQGMLLDALLKARAAGLGDVRLEIEGRK